MNAAIFVLLTCFMKVLSESESLNYIKDKNCVFNETGNYGNLTNAGLIIDFYIPWKITNVSKSTDTLSVSDTENKIKFSIPNPLKDSYNSIIPKEVLRIGWNRLIIELKTIDYFEYHQILIGGIYKRISQHSIEHYKNLFWITGLNSFVNCISDNSKLYWIPAMTDVTIPYEIGNRSNYFHFLSDNQFSMEVTLFRRLQVCYQMERYFTIYSKCSGFFVTTFQKKKIHTISLFPELFEHEDILNYNDMTFSEITFHNIGYEGFYVNIISTNANAPFSALEEKISQKQDNVTTDDSITINTDMNSQDQEYATTDRSVNKDTENSKTLKIIISCGTILIIIGFIFGMISYISHVRKPQQRRFETPFSRIDFFSWPGQTEGYVNAEPMRNRGIRDTEEDEFERRRLEFFASGQNILFVDYLHPSLGVVDVENEYEHYERPENDAENEQEKNKYEQYERPENEDVNEDCKDAEEATTMNPEESMKSLEKLELSVSLTNLKSEDD